MSIDTELFDSERVWRVRFDACRITRGHQKDVLPQLHGDEGEDRLTCLRDDDDAILARSGLFRGAEPTAMAVLSQRLQPVEFPCGHWVFVEGEPGDRLFIIITGKVEIGRQLPDGRLLLTFMGPSDLVGTSLTFDPGPRTSTATTVADVRAVSMDRNTLRDWIAERPESPKYYNATIREPAQSCPTPTT